MCSGQASAERFGRRLGAMGLDHVGSGPSRTAWRRDQMPESGPCMMLAFAHGVPQMGGLYFLCSGVIVAEVGQQGQTGTKQRCLCRGQVADAWSFLGLRTLSSLRPLLLAWGDSRGLSIFISVDVSLPFLSYGARMCSGNGSTYPWCILHPTPGTGGQKAGTRTHTTNP